MRVALFFTPPEQHPLTRAAAAWLGRDAFSGEDLPRSSADTMTQSDVDALTEAPRRYGFHATLKPPFRLVEGSSMDEIEESLSAISSRLVPVDLGKLRVDEIGSFFALTPLAARRAVNGLADEMVRSFDVFRAPASADEIARRRPERLSTRQRDNLERWGYPFVLADFRFHMTLTGPVASDRRVIVRETLERRFLPVLGEPLILDAISLFVEPSPPGDFVVRKRVPLSGTDVAMGAA